MCAYPAAFKECLGSLPRRRDQLIEALHRLLDTCGSLEQEHLEWVAEELGASPAEVCEVVTFYDRFLLAAPLRLMRAFTDSRFTKAFESAPIWDGQLWASQATGAPAWPGGIVNEDPASGTWQPAAPVAPPLDVTGVLGEIAASGLSGKGGAGFSTATKWQAVRGQSGPRQVVVNANEGEPGSRKDRFLLEHASAQVLTGALVAAVAMEAREIHFYICDEYADLLERLRVQAECLSRTWPGVSFAWRRGAGAYVCGEETALLESLEGRAARPRHKPPFPAEQGLFGLPTLVNNVETLFWVNEILARGGRWYAAQGLRGCRGSRFFSVSGRVARPGVYLAPQGITLNELLDEHCGGLDPGQELAAYLPSGATGGLLPASLADLPLDQGALKSHGAALGSASLIVLSGQDDLRVVTARLMDFLAQESCGQCTPCRLGARAAAQALHDAGPSRDDLAGLAQALSLGSICGLGRGAGRLLGCYLRHFHGDQAQ